MCYRIFVRDLAPSILQKSQCYFAHAYLGWSRSAVQILGLNKDSAKFKILKNHIFALFSQSIFIIPTKLSKDIARGKGHLTCEFDLKRP